MSEEAKLEITSAENLPRRSENDAVAALEKRAEGITTAEDLARRSESLPPKAPPPKPTSLYFVNAFVDFGIIGAVSILTYLYFLLFSDGQLTGTVVSLAFYLSWVCNWPHFSATNYRLYHSRENIMQYPITALVIPWVILAGTVGSFLAPSVVAPYFVKLFLIWSPYHFSGQSVGISLIYARRAGFFVGKWERFGLSSFIFGTFLVMTARGEVGLGNNQFWGVTFPKMGIPEWVPTLFEVWMYGGGILFLALAIRWCWKERRLLPPIILLPAGAQYVWFVLGGRIEAYNHFVPFFHSLQYLLIAWSMQLKEKMDLRHIEPSTTYVVKESVRWGTLNVMGGIVLFLAIPHLLGGDLRPYVNITYDTGIALPLAMGVILSAVQIHHFFVDGVIWKLKRKSVSSPLMVNIADLVHPPARPAAAAA
jgi:hypothetical protein